ncbi:MAG: DUF3703 domain-containing protein [Saprospiraceae bacterium]|nr:DUF3703 domain-containing protein [Saprospiraceae bacterium]
MGQIPRLLVEGIKSFVGHIPVGNTGSANVPPLKPMANHSQNRQPKPHSPRQRIKFKT